jgi:serine/threonine protein phosphatase PrpC
VSIENNTEPPLDGPTIQIEPDEDIFTFEYAQHSDPGGREYNEDYCDRLVDEENRRYCYVMADGLGGHQGGQFASQLAVNYIIDNFSRITHENLKTELNVILQEANNHILAQGAKSYQLQDMKTTCVVLIILDCFAYWAHVGDSRLYVIRNHQIIDRTEDHSVVQTLVKMKELKPTEAKSHPLRNQLFKVLGTKYDLTPTIHSEGLKLHRGDCLLLCTDGFWEPIQDSFIEKLTGRQQTADRILNLFIKTAIKIAKVKTAKYDNLTAQLIMVR